MKKPITVCATGHGHPEGPYEHDDGRVIYANSYASEIGVWDPKTGEAGVFAEVGGGPNACMLGSDGCVYSTQTPNVGAWVAPVHRPPSIQKTSPSGEVEILVTEADGVKFDGPNDLAFGPDGRLYFTDSGDWAPETKPHPGRIVVIERSGEAHILGPQFAFPLPRCPIQGLEGLFQSRPMAGSGQRRRTLIVHLCCRPLAQAIQQSLHPLPGFGRQSQRGMPRQTGQRRG